MTTVEELRTNIRRMQSVPSSAHGMVRRPAPTPAQLRGLIELRTGGSYRVDDLSLALALLAAASQAGSWSAIVGVDDLGAEAAAECGIDLSRVVVVPKPGPDWLPAVEALVDVLPFVFLRAPRAVPDKTAMRLGARLRKRAGVLLVQGEWPGAEARLRLSETCWLGVGNGHGRLRARRARVGCRRGTAPERFTEMWLHESGVSSAAMPGDPGSMPDTASGAVPFADAAEMPLAAGGL